MPSRWCPSPGPGAAARRWTRPGQEGVAAVAAALLTEGAGPLPATAFADALRDQAIGLSFSADRDSFEGGFRALLPALPEAVRLAALAMAEPRLDAEAVARVRARAVAAARRALETPRGQAGRAFWAEAYPEHPVGRPSGGTAESLAALPVEAMRAALGTAGAAGRAAGGGGRRHHASATSQALLPRLFAGLPAGAPPAVPPAAGLPPLRPARAAGGRAAILRGVRAGRPRRVRPGLGSGAGADARPRPAAASPRA